MGVNNRQRRAAKQRKQGKGRGPTPPRGWRYDGWSGRWDDDGRSREEWSAVADVLLVEAVRALPGVATTDDQAKQQTAALLEAASAVPRPIVDQVMVDLLDRLLRMLLGSSWSPSDLVEVVRRRLGAPHQALLASCLKPLADDPLMRAKWGVAFEAPAPHQAAALTADEGLATGLRLAALLACLPAPADQVPQQRPTASQVEEPEDARKLATVRALLAKAESTEYDEEAEALSAKAQSLITQYALHHLLERVDHGAEAGTAPDPVVWRRLWLDAPYLLAKAMLVDVVADANRSRSVVSESLGFCTIVGAPSDLDSVELLVTSLLTQASRAMLRHGRLVDRSGVSRTRSFRQSFLVGYATRIGERLRASSSEAVHATGRETALLPMLRDDVTRVEQTMSAMFPSVVGRGASATNGLGWEAGQAAGSLALLDVHANLTEAARP